MGRCYLQYIEIMAIFHCSFVSTYDSKAHSLFHRHVAIICLNKLKFKRWMFPVKSFIFDFLRLPRVLLRFAFCRDQQGTETLQYLSYGKQLKRGAMGQILRGLL